MNGTWYRWRRGVLELRIRVQPRAKREEIAGISDDAVRVRLTAPPVDGKANDELIRLLAMEFDVPRSRVEVVRGVHSRHKTLNVDAPQRIPRKLAGDLTPRLG